MIAHRDGWADCLDYLYAHCQMGRCYPQIDTLYALVLWTLANCAAARRILEVGIGPDSVSGVTFVHALAQYPDGHLMSVDIDPALPQQQFKDLAASKGVVWTQTYGDSLVVPIPAADESVDLLYIDGNHDAAHAIGDLKKFLVVLRPGGYLVIDDFPPTRGLGDGRAEMEAFLAPEQFLHLAHAAPAGNGRLVWQRPL